MYYVYIIQSLKYKRTYVGFCKNLADRLRDHNQGKVKSTRGRRPFRFIFLEKTSTRAKAKKREKYWKSGGGRRKLEKFFHKGFPLIYFL